MKKRNVILLLLVIMILFVGCSKVIQTQTITVLATITEIDYISDLILPVQCGQTTIYQTLPARYEITVEFGDIETTIDNEELYNKYKDKIGNFVMCDLITTHYDNGKISKELKIKK